MGRASCEKEKLIYLRNFLLNETDINHGKNLDEMNEYLADCGLGDKPLDRRSLYHILKLLGWKDTEDSGPESSTQEQLDEKSLREYRLGIKHRRVKNPDTQKMRTEYYVDQRALSQKEVLMLTDMVSSSNFLPQSESEKLITKLKVMLSEAEAKELFHSQVAMKNRVKTTNDEVYRNLNTLAEAIERKKRISFQYYDYVFVRDGDKARRELKKDRTTGQVKCHVVTPDFLLWTDQNYYLIAYRHTGDENEGKELTFRVDRMTNVELTEGKLAKKKPQLREIYTTRIFHMFRGKEQTVELRFRDYLLTAVVDRFGEELKLKKEIVREGDQDVVYYSVRVGVSVSQQFYGWVFGFGDAMEITWPEEARRGMAEELAMLSGRYKTSE